jgi:hypothetical protein
MKKSFPIFLFLLASTISSYGQAQFVKVNRGEGIISAKKFRLAINGTYSYRYGYSRNFLPDDPAFKEYEKKLKSGVTFSVDAAYFVQETLGVGVKFSSYTASSSIDPVKEYIYVEDADTIRIETIIGSVSDEFKINFIGPTLLFRSPLQNGSEIIIGTSIGMLSYTSIYHTPSSDFRFTAKTVGVCIDAEYCINVSSDFQLALLTSLTFGTLNKITNDITGYYGAASGTYQANDNFDKNLARIDIGVGIRFLQ